VSLFGGKITDCLNMGDDVSRTVETLGITLLRRRERFFGEPDSQVQRAFYQRARALRLGNPPAPLSSATLARIYRRHGRDALELCTALEADPSKAKTLVDVAGEEFLRGEIELIARREMVCCLADFLRRRSKLALVAPHDELKHSPGLLEACCILFGPEAQAKHAEYFCGPQRVFTRLCSRPEGGDGREERAERTRST
jgi:glycerol-3-phosphate dehydrogenase